MNDETWTKVNNILKKNEERQKKENDTSITLNTWNNSDLSFTFSAARQHAAFSTYDYLLRNFMNSR